MRLGLICADANLFIYLNSMTEALILSELHRIAFGDLSMQNNTAHYENINEFRGPLRRLYVVVLLTYYLFRLLTYIKKKRFVI